MLGSMQAAACKQEHGRLFGRGAHRLALGEHDLLEEGDDLLLPVDTQVPGGITQQTSADADKEWYVNPNTQCQPAGVHGDGAGLPGLTAGCTGSEWSQHALALQVGEGVGRLRVPDVRLARLHA